MSTKNNSNKSSKSNTEDDGTLKRYQEIMESKSSNISAATAAGASSSDVSQMVTQSTKLTIPTNFRLFDISLDALASPPKLEKNDPASFTIWKDRFKQWSIATGVWKVINNDWITLAVEAVETMGIYGFPNQLAKAKFAELHQRVWGCLCTAVNPVLGNTLANSIEAEQKRRGPPTSISAPLEFNSNYLWKQILSTFDKKAGYASINLFEELLGLHYERKDNPVQFQSKFESLIYQFNSVEGDVIKPNERISEGVKMALLVRALPRALDTTIQSVLSSHETPTIDLVFAAIRRIFEMSKKSDNPGPQPALIADTKPSKKQHKDKRRKGKKEQDKNNDHSASQVSFFLGDETEIQSTLLNHGIADSYFLSDLQPEEEEGDTALNVNAKKTASVASSPGDFDPFLEELTSTRGGELILDTGASKHVVFNADLIYDWKDIEPFHIFGATGHHTIIRKQGTIRLNPQVVIHNVCYSPRATHNLISLAVLLDGGAEVSYIDAKKITIEKKVGEHVGRISFYRFGGSSVWRLILKKPLRQRTQQTSGSSMQLKYDKNLRLRPQSQPRPSLSPTVHVSDSASSKAAQTSMASKFAIPKTQQALARMTRARAQINANAANLLIEPESMHLFVTDDSRNIDQMLNFQMKKNNVAQLWHSRLGHQSDQVVIAADEIFDLQIPKDHLNNLSNCTCVACIKGKGRRDYIGTEADPKWKANEIMECLHLDLLGPISVYTGSGKERIPTPSGCIYALPITEEYSRSVFLELLKHKSDATDKIKEAIDFLQTQTGKRLKRIRCDGGGEFINDEFKEYLKANGTKLTFTTSHTPRHNGIAERMNGVLAEMTRSMIAQSDAPLYLWGEAITYAAFLHNNTPQPVIKDQIPFDLLFGKSYSPDKFRVFGCDAYVYLEDTKRGKFESRFAPGVFMGYDTNQNGFRIKNPETNRITISRNVKFLELSFDIIKDNYDERFVPRRFHSSLELLPTTKATTENLIRSPSIDTVNPYTPLTEITDKDESDDEVEPEAKRDDQAGHKATTTSISTQSTQPSSNTVIKTDEGIKVTFHEPTVTRYGRKTKPLQPYSIMYMAEDSAPFVYAMIQDDDEPKTYKQAMRSPTAEKWKKAMDEELSSLKQHGTWQTVPCPSGITPIKSRWVYKIKRGSDNLPIRYKARLVAKGFQQQYGVDYEETFAPVVKIKSLKIVLSLAAAQDLELKQLDFDTAFLNATLIQDVYMELPDGVRGYPKGTVCKLIKSLYGLKQAPHDWNQDIHQFLISLNYKQIECDKCVYIKRTKADRLIILCLYVDDTIVAFNKLDQDIWTQDKAAIAKKYPIKDIGNCDWILNMKVTRDRPNRVITLSQEAYIKRVLQQFQTAECRTYAYPEIDSDLFAIPKDADSTPLDSKSQTLYQSIVGSILYAALTTRPDIAHAVAELSRFNCEATQYHLTAARHTLRYLAGTTNQGLVFKLNGSPSDMIPEIYVDASWGDDLEKRNSTTGVVVKLNGNVICWNTRKQKTVALSSTEAEYMALTDATTEALWLRTWINEVFQKKIPILIHCDNQSAIALTSNDTFHQRTKHIDIRYHFIRQHVRSGDIKIKWIQTEEQQADILTKRINGKRFIVLREKLMAAI
jgi:hypothetical protein